MKGDILKYINQLVFNRRVGVLLVLRRMFFLPETNERGSFNSASCLCFKKYGLCHQVLASDLPAAGYRNNSNASLNNIGSNGYYWSSTVNSTNSYNLNFNSGNVNPANNNNRANGFSVRCVAELNEEMNHRTAFKSDFKNYDGSALLSDLSPGVFVYPRGT